MIVRWSRLLINETDQFASGYVSAVIDSYGHFEFALGSRIPGAFKRASKKMASNYPPGVTGNEYEIAGADYEKESNTPCPFEEERGWPCGMPTLEQGYGPNRWLVCQEYDHTTDLEPIDEGPDPDQVYDEMRDRQMLGIDVPDELVE